MVVKFIFPVSFPEGGGGTAMLLQSAKGLVSAGIDVEVLIPRSTEREGESLNFNLSGEYQGVRFSYLVKSLFRPKTLIGRYFNFLNGCIRLFSYLRDVKRQNPSGIIIVKGPLDGLTLTLYSIIIRFCGLKSFYNFDDYPDYLLFPGKTAALQRILTEKLAYRLFYGFIVISTALEEHIRQLFGPAPPVYRLPMTVDPSRFDEVDESIPTPKEYILYTGFDFNPGPVFNSKDGLLTLISAFAAIADSCPGIKLVIIGENNPLYHEQAEKLGIKDRVIFTGRRPRSEIIAFQLKAKVLILPRPWSKQAEGGFSSKLGEYLLTGKPVLMTNVGDGGLYLTHMKEAIFAEPGSEPDLREKINWILENYDDALKIGSAGREVALTRFNHLIEGKKLAEFLKDQLG